MRALIQRVLEAKVVVDGETTGEIQHGYWFLGIGRDDTLAIGQKLIDKILKYRIFDDEQGKMGWNVSQANGGILLVSQFTLMAQTQKVCVQTLAQQCHLATQKRYTNNWLNMHILNLKTFKLEYLLLT